jgi:hypothetical protein
MNRYRLHLLKGVSRAEFPIWVLDHSPVAAWVMVHQISDHEAPRFSRLQRWVPSRQSEVLVSVTRFPTYALRRHPSENHGDVASPQWQHCLERLLEFHWPCASPAYKNRGSRGGSVNLYCSFYILTFCRLPWFPSSFCPSSMAGNKRVREEAEEEANEKRVF